MTEKEFAEKWSDDPNMHIEHNKLYEKFMLEDLRSVIREKLIEFRKWVEEEGWIYSSDSLVDKFLNNQ